MKQKEVGEEEEEEEEEEKEKEKEEEKNPPEGVAAKMAISHPKT
jgi:hypothetical protein